MAINKVIYGNSTLIDISDVNVTPADVAAGKLFYKANGVKDIGTLEGATLPTGESAYVDDDTLVIGTGGGITPTGTINITQNGTVDVTNYASASVNVPSEYTIDDVVSLQFHETGNIVLNTADRIAQYAFYGNKNITSIDAPNVQFFGKDSGGIGEYVFAGCSNLESINFPSLTAMGSGGYQFHNCTKLTTVHFPKAVTGQHMFDGCTKLKTVVLLGGGAMNGYGFLKCTSLLVADIDTTRVHTQEFANASKLATLILRRTAGVSTLSNINAFTGTCFANGKTGGTLYVPQALISSYQSATNWSTILGYANNQILSIEGSEYEHYYADGTAIE